jgi:putative oxygen-independent coproporphyrinogen III oxidase
MQPFSRPVPLTLYVHFPWCVRKCPYCDFNSHEALEGLPERDYVDALLADLEHDLFQTRGRRIEAIFFGGGTPSLFSVGSIERLLVGLRDQLDLSPALETTLEANPGRAERGKFSEYRAAGINRLSIGVQSFNSEHLARLGRIHDGRDAIHAAEAAHAAGFENFNLDLMFGLPGQQIEDALSDLAIASDLEPTHISHYQLTVEPNTRFHKYPPVLPDDETIWIMQEACRQRLADSGYEHYEVAAFSRPGQRCHHNLNYWEFGDYLGIGAGAHAKITDTVSGTVSRSWKLKNPRDYLTHAGKPKAIGGNEVVSQAQLSFEFMLNALRLQEGIPTALFSARTGLPVERIAGDLARACEQGLLETGEDHLRPTELGRRFLNDLIAVFLPEGDYD